MSITKKTLVAVLGGAVIIGGVMLNAPAMAAAEGKVSAVDDGGRSITVNGKKFKVSGSRTKVMIGGKEADRDSLKAGMDCKVEGGEEASKIDCK